MLRETLDVLDFLDDARTAADPFAALLPDGDHSIEITPFESDLGRTDFIKILFPGSAGKSGGGSAPNCRAASEWMVNCPTICEPSLPPPAAS